MVALIAFPLAMIFQIVKVNDSNELLHLFASLSLIILTSLFTCFLGTNVFNLLFVKKYENFLLEVMLNHKPSQEIFDLIFECDGSRWPCFEILSLQEDKTWLTAYQEYLVQKNKETLHSLETLGTSEEAKKYRNLLERIAQTPTWKNMGKAKEEWVALASGQYVTEAP
jgi:hypothetical protein